ncbi:MAG TPA: 4Fe-4S dicluster-binding protein, partial [Thermoplasmata archaeon]|nr:4Fe-4S dicluster-binding protein [Thermoplasmata archaeon]
MASPAAPAAPAPAAPPRPATPPPLAPVPPPAPADPLVAYYRKVRQMNWELARERYKDKGVKARTQEYIRGRGTTAIVDDEVCMGCMHCFDNCAFEAISAVDRKFSLPDYTYTSRKATIIVDNCVGCEKCAIVCPVDAINMITKFGFESREGKV